MTTTVFEVRRENLRRIVLDKFEGNRAAFSRAAGVHQNQINLLLTDNLEHRRNLGETLARKMEAALHLDEGYFDSARATTADSSFTIPAWNIPTNLLPIVGRDDALVGLTLLDSFMATLAGKITAKNHLATCRISTFDLSPELPMGERVVIDTNVQAVTVDGVYLLSRKGDVFLRRVTKQLSGGWLIHTPNAGLESVKVDSLRDIKAQGRVVMVVRIAVV